MKKLVKILLIIGLVLIIFGLIKYFIPNSVSEISNKDFVENEINFDYTSIKVDNKASVLMNLDTNQIIYSNNMNQATPVYSVSKVMFLATVAKKMKEDNISYDTKIKADSIVDKVNKQGNFSNAGLSSNDTYTIKELFDAVMIPSGNDAAILLAYEIFGSHANAVSQMNEDAKEWGMNDSSFISTSGLDGKYLNDVGIEATSGKNLMSPYDSIILVKKVVSEYTEIVDSGSKTTSTIGTNNSEKIKLESVNEIMFNYDDIYGLKTGSNIEKYSNCIIALKKNEHNQDILAISYSSKTRASLYDDIESLYNYLDALKLTNLQDEIELNTKVGFVNNEVSFSLEEPFYLYHEDNQKFEYNLVNLSSKYNKSLNRFYNIKQNDVLGDLTISNSEEFFDGTPLNLSKVVAASEVDSKGILGSIKEFLIELAKK